MPNYVLNHPEEIVSPSLIYYRDIFEANTEAVTALAGGPEHLWPHVKTHKSADMVKYQIGCGIRRFKAATLAELEMICQAGAKSALLAMSPAGPTPRRLAKIQKAYPDTEVLGIVDSEYHLAGYSQAALESGLEIGLLLDVNMGLDRSGVPVEAAGALYKKAAAVPGIRMRGFHCYDGDRHENSRTQRQNYVDQADGSVFSLRHTLISEGYPVEYMVMGCSPSFPCHMEHRESGVYYAPGTLFINDISYAQSFPDLKMAPAAAILCRVISHPRDGVFTLDLGYKGISSEMSLETRGVLIGVEHCRPVFQNEEHWVFRMDTGYEADRPPLGTVLYVLPHHICPCAVLYPELLIAENGEIVDSWPVTARDRKINY